MLVTAAGVSSVVRMGIMGGRGLLCVGRRVVIFLTGYNRIRPFHRRGECCIFGFPVSLIYTLCVLVETSYLCRLVFHMNVSFSIAPEN